MIHLEMLRVRSFAMAELAILLFMVAFSAMLLGGVLFMTEVRGDSVLRAGLSLSPGAAHGRHLLGLISGRQVARLGQRSLAATGLPGSSPSAASGSARPADRRRRLRGRHAARACCSRGIGVGFVLPSTSSAAASSLPPDPVRDGQRGRSRCPGRSARSLGVSILVAILDTPSRTDPVATFDGALDAHARGVAARRGRRAGDRPRADPTRRPFSPAPAPPPSPVRRNVVQLQSVSPTTATAAPPRAVDGAAQLGAAGPAAPRPGRRGCARRGPQRSTPRGGRGRPSLFDRSRRSGGAAAGWRHAVHGRPSCSAAPPRARRPRHRAARDGSVTATYGRRAASRGRRRPCRPARRSGRPGDGGELAGEAARPARARRRRVNDDHA